MTRVDGVMIGRAAYQNPYLSAEIDRRFFGEAAPPPSRAEVVCAPVPHAEEAGPRGVPIKSITRHIMGLFNGLPGARLWRRHLSEAAHPPGAGPEVLLEALDLVMERLEARGLAA